MGVTGGGRAGRAWARPEYTIGPIMRSTIGTSWLPLLAVAGLVAGVRGHRPRAAPAAKKPKYYFKIVEVKSATADDVTKATAREVLEAELASRPEFTPELRRGQ